MLKFKIILISPAVFTSVIKITFDLFRWTYSNIIPDVAIVTGELGESFVASSRMAQLAA